VRTLRFAEVVIQNVVATARLNVDVDLKTIAQAFPHVEYRPEIFPGLSFKMMNPKSCVLIFESGKMVCTGAKSEKQALEIIFKVVDELREAGIDTGLGAIDFAVQNIVASVDLGEVTIDVEEAIHKIDRVMYEPDQFPGAIHRMDKPNVVFLIFVSGKLVCVGARKEEDISKAVNKLVSLLTRKGVLIKRTHR